MTQPMTTHPSAPKGDRDVSPGAVLGSSLVVAMAIAASVVVTWVVLWGARGRVRLSEDPTWMEVSADERNEVATGLYTEEGYAARARAEKLRRLNAFGWQRRDTGRVHIPIAVAIDLYLEQKGGAP